MLKDKNNRPNNKIEIELEYDDQDKMICVKWIEQDTQDNIVVDEKYNIVVDENGSYIKLQHHDKSIISTEIETFFILKSENDINIIKKDFDVKKHGVIVSRIAEFKKIKHIYKSDNFTKETFYCCNQIFIDDLKVDLCESGSYRFKNCIFLGKTSVVDSKSGRIGTKGNKDIRDISFRDSYLKKEFIMSKCSLEKVYFSDCFFKDNMTIEKTGVDEQLECTNILVAETFKVYGIRISTFCIDNSTIKKVHFSAMTVDRFIATTNEIKSAHSYQDFTHLKNSALSQYDNIKALEYYVQEMNKHLKELGTPVSNNCKNNGHESKTIDRIILTFEKYVSYFGTNPVLPVIWLLVIHYVLAYTTTFMTFVLLAGLAIIIFVMLYMIMPNKIQSTKTQLPILGILILGIFYSESLLCSIENMKNFVFDSPVDLALGLIKYIITSALIYETIKSFRKYSRKL